MYINNKNVIKIIMKIKDKKFNLIIFYFIKSNNILMYII